MDTKHIPITVGSRVGHLTVSGKTDERKNGYTVWRCACDCGGEIDLDAARPVEPSADQKQYQRL